MSKLQTYEQLQNEKFCLKKAREMLGDMSDSTNAMSIMNLINTLLEVDNSRFRVNIHGYSYTINDVNQDN